jgi:hypothetical protein
LLHLGTFFISLIEAVTFFLFLSMLLSNDQLQYGVCLFENPT